MSQRRRRRGRGDFEEIWGFASNQEGKKEKMIRKSLQKSGDSIKVCQYYDYCTIDKIWYLVYRAFNSIFN